MVVHLDIPGNWSTATDARNTSCTSQRYGVTPPLVASSFDLDQLTSSVIHAWVPTGSA
jgi:hypothetical protein